MAQCNCSRSLVTKSQNEVDALRFYRPQIFRYPVPRGSLSQPLDKIVPKQSGGKYDQRQKGPSQHDQRQRGPSQHDQRQRDQSRGSRRNPNPQSGDVSYKSISGRRQLSKPRLIFSDNEEPIPVEIKEEGSDRPRCPEAELSIAPEADISSVLDAGIGSGESTEVIQLIDKKPTPNVSTPSVDKWTKIRVDLSRSMDRLAEFTKLWMKTGSKANKADENTLKATDASNEANFRGISQIAETLETKARSPLNNSDGTELLSSSQAQENSKEDSNEHMNAREMMIITGVKTSLTKSGTLKNIFTKKASGNNASAEIKTEKTSSTKQEDCALSVNIKKTDKALQDSLRTRFDGKDDGKDLKKIIFSCIILVLLASCLFNYTYCVISQDCSQTGSAPEPCKSFWDLCTMKVWYGKLAEGVRNLAGIAISLAESARNWILGATPKMNKPPTPSRLIRCASLRVLCPWPICNCKTGS